MGISGLLPALKKIQVSKHLSEFAGQTLAVDAYVWLHKGVYACAGQLATGKKTHKKSWKRMITKPTFVGNDFTRRPVKYERFIRPMGLRYKKANVTQYV